MSLHICVQLEICIVPVCHTLLIFLSWFLNVSQVFRPYAKHWLGPLLQLVVSGNNGGEGIHFMVVDVVVTVLSWTSLASPKVGHLREYLNTVNVNNWLPVQQNTSAVSYVS